MGSQEAKSKGELSNLKTVGITAEWKEYAGEASMQGVSGRAGVGRHEGQIRTGQLRRMGWRRT